MRMTKWYHWPAFGFGSGLTARAPGTWGSLAALPFCVLIPLMPLPVWLSLLVVLSLAGIYFCHKTAADMGIKDHPSIVWDEFIGMWITMTFVPVSIATLAIGFGLFRLFDIWKPWPIRLLDRKVDGGLGIMIDDIIAGIFAAASLVLLVKAVPSIVHLI